MTAAPAETAGGGITEAAIAAWEDQPRRTRPDTPPVLSVAGFAGPLDWLLEMARAKKLDLARLSIAALIEAFATAMTAALVEHGTGRIEHWAAWTVMAASLTELWSRLLLPHDAPAAREAETEAEALRRLLLARAQMREAAAWLERRPQLGQAVFARGTAEASASNRAGALTDLLRACLVALRVPAHQAAAPATLPPRLWQASQAIGLLRARLGTLPDGSALEDFLPPLAPGPQAGLRRRAALASTLVAGLELARDSVLTLEQDAPWAAIHIARRHAAPARGAGGQAG